MRVLKAALDMAFDEVTARESKNVAEGELVLVVGSKRVNR